MADIQVFTYQSSEVRTVELNGEPWFVLKDVCDVLGLSKYRDVAERLDDDERAPVRVDTLHPLERSGRRVLTGPRSDAGQTGPQRRRSEGKAATTGAIPRAGSPAPACFLLFCPINGPFSRHFPAPLAHARSDESFGGKRPNHHPLSILHARG